jgi:hypothetical protein
MTPTMLILGIAATVLGAGEPAAPSPLSFAVKGGILEVRGQVLGRSFTATATRAETSADKEWLTLTGTKQQPAELRMAAKPPGSATDVTRAQSIRVRLSNGTVDAAGAGRIEVK